MELCSIASGSSGNCILAGAGGSRLLIDAGISGKRIEQGLNSLGHKTCEMKGVLVTHEHIDHISGLGVIARRYGLPVYATKGTAEAILKTSQVGKIDPELFHIITPDQTFTVGELSVLPLCISHDAADPVAYVIKSGGNSAAVLTDLGTYGDDLTDRLRGIDLLLVEANHDENMLQAGSYPYYLKRRILGERGHLSNENCGRLLARLLHDHCRGVLLGHLSKENNYPQLALEAVRMEITMGDCPYEGRDFPISVADRNGVSELLAV